MMKVRKAVFPVAGLGTRLFPVTKAVPKELLPILNKPLIQYAVEEAIAAGIDTLIFITGGNKRAIRDYFDRNNELDFVLREKGQHEAANVLRDILPAGVKCIFVRQPEPLGLGHAILCAERAVGNEPFAVLLADDFINHHGDGVTVGLVRAFEASGKTQLSIMEINGPDISKYGVVLYNKEVGSVAGLIEKPAANNAPSNLASIGRYIITPDVFDILRNQCVGVGGEIQLADAINTQASNDGVEAVMLNGRRFDCGSLEGLLEANIYMRDWWLRIGVS